MTFRNMYDPRVYAKFEENYKMTSGKHMNARIAFGALYAYYKSNQGTLFGIDFWESIHEDHIDGMHVHEVNRLLEAFRDNRQLHRSHFLTKLDTHYKSVIMKKWRDEEVWTKIFETACHKNKINNTHDFHLILSIMNKM